MSDIRAAVEILETMATLHREGKITHARAADTIRYKVIPLMKRVRSVRYAYISILFAVLTIVINFVQIFSRLGE